MLELPEASIMAKQIRETLTGKTVKKVIAGKDPHKLAWYYGEPEKYQELLAGKSITNAKGYGGLVEIEADDIRMLFGDGVNVRFLKKDDKPPKKHQLHLEFQDGSNLFASVQMYGGLGAYKEGDNDNEYYLAAKKKPHPLSGDFTKKYFDEIVNSSSG
jgi:formamidopyrimidine-DNA glycosylase